MVSVSCTVRATLAWPATPSCLYRFAMKHATVPSSLTRLWCLHSQEALSLAKLFHELCTKGQAGQLEIALSGHTPDEICSSLDSAVRRAATFAVM